MFLRGLGGIGFGEWCWVPLEMPIKHPGGDVWYGDLEPREVRAEVENLYVRQVFWIWEWIEERTGKERRSEEWVLGWSAFECGERVSQERGIRCVCCSLGDLEEVVWRNGCSRFMREREWGENSDSSDRRDSVGLLEWRSIHVPRHPIFTWLKIPTQRVLTVTWHLWELLLFIFF